MTERFWSDEKISDLRLLWKKGLSAGVIAASLQCSRNAVIGKAHRLGLDARPSPIIRAAELA